MTILKGLATKSANVKEVDLRLNRSISLVDYLKLCLFCIFIFLSPEVSKECATVLKMQMTPRISHPCTCNRLGIKAILSDMWSMHTACWCLICVHMVRKAVHLQTHHLRSKPSGFCRLRLWTSWSKTLTMCGMDFAIHTQNPQPLWSVVNCFIVMEVLWEKRRTAWTLGNDILILLFKIQTGLVIYVWLI